MQSRNGPVVQQSFNLERPAAAANCHLGQEGFVMWRGFSKACTRFDLSNYDVFISPEGLDLSLAKIPVVPGIMAKFGEERNSRQSAPPHAFDLFRPIIKPLATHFSMTCSLRLHIKLDCGNNRVLVRLDHVITDEIFE